MNPTMSSPSPEATTLTPWHDVPLYWLDGKELTDAERVAALTEYRESGAIAGVVLADPNTYPDDGFPTDGGVPLWNAGPAFDEIDWAGFERAMEEGV